MKKIYICPAVVAVEMDAEGMLMTFSTDVDNSNSAGASDSYSIDDSSIWGSTGPDLWAEDGDD